MLVELYHYGWVNRHRAGSVLVTRVAFRGVFFTLENRSANGDRPLVQVHVTLNPQGEKLTGSRPAAGCQSEKRAHPTRVSPADAAQIFAGEALELDACGQIIASSEDRAFWPIIVKRRD